MNTYLLGGLTLAGLLVLIGVLLLLRRRPRPPARDDGRATLPVGTAVADAPVHPTPAASAPASGPAVAAHGADAQRLAATEALRQARQRKAEEAARLQAERQAETQALAQAEARALAQAQAEARAQAPARPAQRPPVPPVARPAERITPVLSPLAIHTAPTATTTAPPSAPGLAPLRAPSRPAGPPTVLLADDSKVVRVKTGRLLEKEGWRVLLADDGLAALQQLDAEGADLLITDVEMPGLDGFELTRRVRAHPRWGRLPVIMITSSDDKHRDQATAAGVNLLMGKPYEEEFLLAQARQLLGAAVGRAAPGLALH